MSEPVITNEVEISNGEEKIVKTKSPEIVEKESLLFKRGIGGEMLPEKVECIAYDTKIDQEILEEGIMLDSFHQRMSIIARSSEEATTRMKNKISELEEALSRVESGTETEKEIKEELDKAREEYEKKSFNDKIALDMAREKINESLGLIDELELLKTKGEKFIVELTPCTEGESMSIIERKRDEHGKDLGESWVDYLISRKLKNPEIIIGEVKNMHPWKKEAIKRKILEISFYKTKSYRDVLLEVKRNALKKKEIEHQKKKPESLK